MAIHRAFFDIIGVSVVLLGTVVRFISVFDRGLKVCSRLLDEVMNSCFFVSIGLQRIKIVLRWWMWLAPKQGRLTVKTCVFAVVLSWISRVRLPMVNIDLLVSSMGSSVFLWLDYSLVLAVWLKVSTCFEDEFVSIMPLVTIGLLARLWTKVTVWFMCDFVIRVS